MQNSYNILGYEVHRKKVKNINLRVNNKGDIYISAPLNLDDTYIERFILSKKKWIDANIEKFKKIEQIKSTFEKYENDTLIKFKGEIYCLKIKKGSYKVLIEDKTILIQNTDISSNAIKNIIYNDIYYKYAKKVFIKRLNHYKKIMNLEKNISLTISPMKSKWGMCKYTKNEIYLNIELAKKNLLQLDLVVVHELTHLIYPNHSKAFYLHIDKYFKNYKQINEKLNSQI